MTGIETIAAVATPQVVAGIAKVNALKNALEANEIGPALLAATGGASAEYGGLLNGMLDASENMRTWLESSGMLEAWTSTREGIEDTAAEVADSMEVFTNEFLDRTGLGDAVEHGIAEGTEFVADAIPKLDGKLIESRARLADPYIYTTEMPVPPEIKDLLDDAIHPFALPPSPEITFDFFDDVFGKAKEIWRDPAVIAVPLERLAEFEQEVLKWCDDKGCLLTAKKIDTVVGTQYVPGLACEVPLVGNMANVILKTQLDEELTSEELAKAGVDGALILTLVAAPYLLPAGAVAAGSGTFVAQTAMTGAAIGGSHGGLMAAITEYANSGDMAKAFEAAGKGILQGAVLGAAGGAAGGAVLYHAGAGLSGSVAAGVAGGAAPGAIAGGVEGFKETGTVEGALQGAGEGALKGGALGGIIGGAAHGFGRLTGQIKPLGDYPEGLPNPDGLLVRTAVDRSNINYGSETIIPGMARHHIKPLSLGGPDVSSNITHIPIKIHSAPHPSHSVINAPTGTIFFS